MKPERAEFEDTGFQETSDKLFDVIELIDRATVVPQRLKQEILSKLKPAYNETVEVFWMYESLSK